MGRLSESGFLGLGCLGLFLYAFCLVVGCLWGGPFFLALVGGILI